MSKNINETIDYEIVANISNPILVTDTRGEILFMNAVSQSIQHLHKPHLQIGGMLLASVQEQWKHLLMNIMGSVCDTKSPASLEAEYIADGKKSFYDVVCCPIQQEGVVDRLMFEFKDITLQKIYESKTRSMAHDLASFTETVNAVVMSIDVRGFIVAWNNCAAELTGYPQADALARHFTELIVNGDGQDILFGIIKETLNGNSVSNRELPVLTRTSQKLNLLINATSRRNADMEIVGILVIGLDITELTEYKHSLEKKVRDRTQALEKEKELIEVKKRFVSIASHEFRVPISVIKLQTDALRNMMNAGFDADIVARINRIYDQAEHISVLLEDVLLIGKGDTGKISANIEMIELKGILESVISDIENTTSKSHHVVLNFPGDFLYINSDKSILRNIFVNLLSNAVKFSPERDRVYFDVVRHGSLIELAVSDEGIGISECDLRKIFQPFSRASNASSIKGTGLGLSIVKKAVAALNGRVWVESKLNEGSKFTVQLKLNSSSHGR